MSRSPSRYNRFSAFAGACCLLALAPDLQAQNSHPRDDALLAMNVTRNGGQVGMMCADELERNQPRCVRFVAKSDALCLRRRSGILNPDTMAFDVTAWPRQAIAGLLHSLNEMEDPLNHDFGRMSIAGYRIRRVEESFTPGDDIPEAPAFDLSSGCYLLVKTAPSEPALGS
jgi:hypothetical protein